MVPEKNDIASPGNVPMVRMSTIDKGKVGKGFPAVYPTTPQSDSAPLNVGDVKISMPPAFFATAIVGSPFILRIEPGPSASLKLFTGSSASHVQRSSTRAATNVIQWGARSPSAFILAPPYLQSATHRRLLNWLQENCNTPCEWTKCYRPTDIPPHISYDSDIWIPLNSECREMRL